MLGGAVEERVDVVADFHCQPRVGIVHAEDHAAEFETVVEPPGDEFDRLQQFAQTVQRQKCGWRGMKTSSTAASALSVSTPRDGGQSTNR